MWNWFNCYLSGRHDFGIWCEPGAIFLRCVHCGRRSSGWSLNAAQGAPPAEPPAVIAGKAAPRVLPFDRAPAG
jgi:hypothetical protein